MIRENIQKETIAAMKAGDKQRTAALRLIGAKVKDRDIEMRTATSVPDDDDLLTDVLLKMAKQRRESITMYEDGGREELAAKERAELAVIEEFLPQMLDEGQMRVAVEEAKNTVGAQSMKDMGKVMAELKARHGVLLDMSKAGPMVKESLS
ncbi:GatB/YqeY domain-containing protein [Altererythrobacter aurantiacus]|uniref:GatB/YqeY domain-containing protein n=1 Tax=Parapontixanthobacter aurantiacus TaxID=1463599 RepID=A0A844ZD65_9SPHN|nr:GatB/YqeY domain-containing protein [Parapontixanthobacter aurantiacus]MXO85212.1 GatB/YqeY domain-containing protein [Parapontixanthobacter aurantiacus]